MACNGHWALSLRTSTAPTRHASMGAYMGEERGSGGLDEPMICADASSCRRTFQDRRLMLIMSYGRSAQYPFHPGGFHQSRVLARSDWADRRSNRVNNDEQPVHARPAMFAIRAAALGNSSGQGVVHGEMRGMHRPDPARHLAGQPPGRPSWQQQPAPWNAPTAAAVGPWLGRHPRIQGLPVAAGSPCCRLQTTTATTIALSKGGRMQTATPPACNRALRTNFS
jgi:hypothetical protein